MPSRKARVLKSPLFPQNSLISVELAFILGEGEGECMVSRIQLQMRAGLCHTDSRLMARAGQGLPGWQDSAVVSRWCPGRAELLLHLCFQLKALGCSSTQPLILFQLASTGLFRRSLLPCPIPPFPSSPPATTPASQTCTEARAGSSFVDIFCPSETYGYKTQEMEKRWAKQSPSSEGPFLLSCSSLTKGKYWEACEELSPPLPLAGA